MFRIILKELGYDDITCCCSVDEAKELLEKEPFSLIFSDWHMPHSGSGLDLLRWVRATAGLANIPFIMITTETKKEKIYEAVKAGLQSYVFKPIHKDIVKQKLTDLSKLYGFQEPV